MKVSTLIGIIATLVLACTGCTSDATQTDNGPGWGNRTPAPIPTGNGWLIVVGKSTLEGAYYLESCNSSFRLLPTIRSHGKQVPAEAIWERTKAGLEPYTQFDTPWVRIVKDPISGEAIIDLVEFRTPDPNSGIASMGILCMKGMGPLFYPAR